MCISGDAMRRRCSVRDVVSSPFRFITVPPAFHPRFARGIARDTAGDTAIPRYMIPRYISF